MPIVSNLAEPAAALYLTTMDRLPPEGPDPKSINPAAQEMGRHLRDQRKARRISVRDLAKRLGVSEPYIYLLETGRKSLNYEIALKIAYALRIDATPLVEWVKQHRPRSYLSAIEGTAESEQQERRTEREAFDDRTDAATRLRNERRPPLDSAREYLEQLEHLREPRRRRRTTSAAIPVPVYEAGRPPVGDAGVKDHLPFHPRLLPVRVLPEDLFAYTVDWRMARRVPDAIAEDDIVVLTRDMTHPRPRTVYAVDMDGVVELARVSQDRNGMIVEDEPRSRREGPPLRFAYAEDDPRTRTRILGRVIAIIRRMR